MYLILPPPGKLGNMWTGTANAAVGGRAAERGSGAGLTQLQSHLELGALPGAVPCARLHVRHVLREWGVAYLAEDAELITSELTTNAIQASEGLEALPVVRLWVTCDDGAVVVSVWDACDCPPVVREPGVDEGGRGLAIVGAVCKDWGWYGTGDGKIVWARLGK